MCVRLCWRQSKEVDKLPGMPEAEWHWSSRSLSISLPDRGLFIKMEIELCYFHVCRLTLGTPANPSKNKYIHTLVCKNKVCSSAKKCAHILCKIHQYRGPNVSQQWGEMCGVIWTYGKYTNISSTTVSLCNSCKGTLQTYGEQINWEAAKRGSTQGWRK